MIWSNSMFFYITSEKKRVPKVSVKVIETRGPSILHSTVTFPIAGAVLSTNRDKLSPVEYNEHLTLAINHFIGVISWYCMFFNP